MTAYRELVLPGAANAANADAIKTFNAVFGGDEITLTRRADAIVVRLREVDADKLKRTCMNLSAREGAALFEDVWRAVDGVKSYGVRGGRRNYVDYNKERKVAGRKIKERQRTPHYYAPADAFKRENRALPPEYHNRIMCGDGEAVLRALPDNCVDLVFTSPPYNFGLAYAQGGDAKYWQEYYDKLFCVFRQCIRVVKYGGRIIVNVQPLFSDYIPSHHIISNFFMGEKLIWKGEILWEKNNYNCKYTAWGSWKSPSNPYLKYTWEFLEIFCKGDLKKSGKRDDIDISAEEFKKWVVGKWSIAPERKMKEYGHPAMFPEELAQRVIKLFSYKGDVVLDPFNGVGTATYVAKRLGRGYLGIDISPEYCQKAENRIDSLNLALFKDE